MNDVIYETLKYLNCLILTFGVSNDHNKMPESNMVIATKDITLVLLIFLFYIKVAKHLKLYR